MTTQDAEAGCAMLERAYRHLRLERPNATIFRMTLATASAPPLGFQQLRLAGMPSSGSNDGIALVRIGHLFHGRFTIRSGRHEIHGGGAFLFPATTYAAFWEDLGLSTLTVEETVAADYARAVVGREDFRLQFTGYRPINPAMERYWRATVAHLVRQVLPNDTAMAAPLLRAQMITMVVAALLQTFPNTFLEVVSDRSGAGAQGHRPAALRRPGGLHRHPPGRAHRAGRDRRRRQDEPPRIAGSLPA